MKNYDSKINPFLGAGILGAAAPAAVYLIGFLAMLLWVAASLLFLPFYYLLDFDAITNAAAIIAAVLQAIAVVAFTLLISVFADLKIYHLLISAAVSGVLFFIVERFIPKVRWVNFPWQTAIFPKLFANQLDVRFDSLTNSEFVEQRMYFKTAPILTGTFFAISLITWGIYRAASRNKQRGDEL